MSLKDLTGADIHILFGAIDQDGNVIVETNSEDDIAAALALDDIELSEIHCSRTLLVFCLNVLPCLTFDERNIVFLKISLWF